MAMSFSPAPSGLVGSNSVQEQRERWGRKRNCAVRALVQSEQRYCEQLELVTTYFVDILKAKGTLRQDIRESIFSSIKSIYSVNQSLLVHLENDYIGRGFEQFCLKLHHYNTYADNIYNASKVLTAQLKKNKAFRRFTTLQEARSEFRNCKLEELLPLPVQRIQQYKDLLQDLTENTSPDNPEFEQLSSAARAVSEVSQRIQDNARSHENHLQLRRVQKLLKGRKTKVLASGRWYIREGWLKTVPSKGAEAKPRMYFLFSDMLLQARRCGLLQPTGGDKLQGLQAYPLKECTVDKVFGHTRSRGGLLSLTFPKAKLLLMSSDQEDLNDWCQSLTSAISKLHSKNTVVHKGDDLCRRPLRSVPDSHQNQPDACIVPGRKRNMASSSEPADGAASSSSTSAVPAGSKRMKLSGDAALSSPEPTGFSCVVL